MATDWQAEEPPDDYGVPILTMDDEKLEELQRIAEACRWTEIADDCRRELQRGELSE